MFRSWLFLWVLAWATFALPASAEPDAAPLIVIVEGLDRDETRTAVSNELRAPAIDASDPEAPHARGTLTVSLDEGNLVVRFECAGKTPVERRVRAPEGAAERLRTVALLAGNVARDEASELLAKETPPPPPAPMPLPPPLSFCDALDSASSYRPLAVSLFPPLATHGRLAKSHVSLELIYGRSAFIQGVSLGTASSVTCRMQGLQLGLVARGTGEVTGAQLGLVTTGKDVQGLQGGMVNVAQNVDGVQLGLVNVGRKVRGVQLGLVNIAEDVEGLSLAFLPIVKSGKIRAMAWTGNLSYINVGVQFDTRHYYFATSIGIFGEEATTDMMSTFLFALHVLKPEPHVFFDIGAGYYQYARKETERGSGPRVMMNVRGGWRFAERFAVFASFGGALMFEDQPGRQDSYELGPDVAGGILF